MAKERSISGKTIESTEPDKSSNNKNLYNPEADNPPKSTKNSSARAGQSISWTASEFVHHHKSFSWFLKLGLAIVAIAATAVVIGDIIAAVFIVIVGILFGIVAGKAPQTQTFQIDDSGVNIGAKFYPYKDFKSFAVLHEGEVGVINLLSLKRFMPELSIYYPPDQEAKIVEVLSANLPNDEREEHSFDKLMRRIRF